MRDFTDSADVTSTPDVLAPLANATGGEMRRLETSAGLSVPRVLVHGDDWIGVKMRDARLGACPGRSAGAAVVDRARQPGVRFNPSQLDQSLPRTCCAKLAP